ncbi:MAG: hypothetical protein QOF11_2685 [Chloroflexota bacterium]|jgi:hypothetical protein|nr:hypothetical protein [Chloroflexota bacterium]
MRVRVAHQSPGIAGCAEPDRARNASTMAFACQADTPEFQSLADAMNFAFLFWAGVIALGLTLLIWATGRNRPRP